MIVWLPLHSAVDEIGVKSDEKVKTDGSGSVYEMSADKSSDLPCVRRQQ